jgi:hypothetical protein
MVHSGCSAGFERSNPAQPSVSTGASSLQLRADWSDVEATMEVAAPRAEAAVVQTLVSPHSIRFTLVTATDEPGEVLAVRDPADSSSGENIQITLSAHFGRFGDSAREQRLLNAMARRLGQLHGTATAPIHW